MRFVEIKTPKPDSRGRGGFLYNAAFHLLLGRVYDDKDVQERIIRSSKLEWVIVRPVILSDGPKTILTTDESRR